MFESIFLLLALIAMFIVIIACVRGYNNENTLKALIIFAGACMVLASVMDRWIK